MTATPPPPFPTLIPYDRCNLAKFTPSGDCILKRHTLDLWREPVPNQPSGQPGAFVQLSSEAYRVRNTNYTTGGSAQISGETWGRGAVVAVVDGAIITVARDIAATANLKLYYAVWDAYDGHPIIKMQQLPVDSGAYHTLVWHVASDGLVLSFDNDSAGILSQRRVHIAADGTVTDDVASDVDKTGPVTFGISKSGTLCSLVREVISTDPSVLEWGVYIYDGTTQTKAILPDDGTLLYRFLTFSSHSDKAYVYRIETDDAQWFEIDIATATATPIGTAGTIDIPPNISEIRDINEETFWIASNGTSGDVRLWDITDNDGDSEAQNITMSSISASHPYLHSAAANAASDQTDAEGTVLVACSQNSPSLGDDVVLHAIRKDGTVATLTDFGTMGYQLVSFVVRIIGATRGEWYVSNFLSTDSPSDRPSDEMGSTGQTFPSYPGLMKVTLDYDTNTLSIDWVWRCFQGIAKLKDSEGNICVLDTTVPTRSSSTVPGVSEYSSSVWRAMDIEPYEWDE